MDDVEFFFQPDNTTVEYRSASRLGESDLDANRKRIRDLRVALQDMVSNHYVACFLPAIPTVLVLTMPLQLFFSLKG